MEGKGRDGMGGGRCERSDEVKRSRDGSEEEGREGENWGGDKASGEGET